MRAEGASPWFTARHDEFALCLDGTVEVPSPGTRAQHRKATGLDGAPDGPRMGRIKAGRGHLALLPEGAAYRIAAVRPSVVLFQSIDGPLTAHKWADICQTD